MGVLGLWQLLAPVGQPVTLESLENKTLAVDISIWLNQAIKGYRDATGGAVRNAHLLSLFSRLCKLLHYRIRPIIVFDGGVPELKKQTVINRQQRRNALKQSSRDAGRKALVNYMTAQGLDVEKASPSFRINPVLSTKPAVDDDIFALPAVPKSSESDELSEAESSFKHEALSKEDLKYLTQIDIDSDEFQALPPEVKQEILSNLIESRKHRHWSYYENLPEDSGEFSSYQMQCLLKRRKMKSKLEAVHHDIQKKHCTDIISLYGNEMYGEPSKVMSDDVSHFVFLKKLVNSESTLLDSKEHKKSKNDSLHEKPVKTKVGVEKSSNQSTSLTDYDNPPCTFYEGSDDAYSNDEDVDDPTSFVNSSISGGNCIGFGVDSKVVHNKDLNSKVIEIEETKICEKNPSESTITSNADISMLKQMETLQNKEVSIKPGGNNFGCLASSCAAESVPFIQKESESISSNVSKVISDIESSDDDSLESVPEMDTNHAFENFLATKNFKSNSCAGNILNNSSNSLDILHQLSKPETSVDSSNNVCSSTPNNISSTGSLPTENEVITSDISKKDLELRTNIQKELEDVNVLLQAEHAKQQRQASTVQEHMVQECKDLLKLFGVPYIVSPMEAEAQCAFYDLSELTHGTITDDSDIWLFGGKRIYKNFFAQKKYVEFYQEKEIASHFNLDRAKLVCFAMLTGSDYTEGIENVGPVTAMEILSEFGGNGIEILSKFKQWWEESNKCASPPKNKVRAKLRKLSVSDGFPNRIVFETYLNPEVDSSTESFSWGLPDLDAIRDFAKAKFGWDKSKVDDTLLPVIKRLSERTAQTHLDSFFTVNLKKEKNLFPSKRITSALKKINPGKTFIEEIKDRKGQVSQSGSFKTTKRGKRPTKNVGKTVVKSIRKSKVMDVVQLSEESSCDDPSD